MIRRLALLVALVVAGCGDNLATTAPTGCTVDADCPASTACATASCSAGTCITTPAAAGTAVTQQVIGDCQQAQCDGDGNIVSVPDNTDVPAAVACRIESCDSGSAHHEPAPEGTACGSGLECDGGGDCVHCTLPNECPGSDTDCQARTCLEGVCGFDNQPAGIVAAHQVAGDCHKSVCDGSGNILSNVDNTDVPNDHDACTGDVCTSGVPSNPDLGSGTACGSGLQCDGSGDCVTCLDATQCPGSDTDCETRTCTAGTCGFAFAGSGTPTSLQTIGDCVDSVCDGSGNIVQVPDGSDTPDDHDDCTSDSCSNGSAVFTDLPQGTSCAGNLECDGSGGCGFCGDGVAAGFEECDGSDLASASCTSLGFTTGTLACDVACTFDTSSCTTCGNGVLEPGEDCDGSNFGGATCSSEGFSDGQLSCSTPGCTIDTSTCGTCGNGVIDGDEVCDPGNGADIPPSFGSATCTNLGHAPGTLACSADCNSIDVRHCDGGFVPANLGSDGTELEGTICIDGLKFQLRAGNTFIAACTEDNGVWSADLTDSSGDALDEPSWFLNDCSWLPIPCTTAIAGPVTSLHGRSIFTSPTSATTVVYLSTDAGNGLAPPDNGPFDEFRAPAFAATAAAPANWASNANSQPNSFSQELFTAVLGTSTNNWLGGWDPVAGASVVHALGVPATPVSVGGGSGTVTSLVSGLLAVNGSPILDIHAAVFGKGPDDVHDDTGPDVAGGGIYWSCDLGATYIEDDAGIGADGSTDASKVFTLAVDETSLGTFGAGGIPAGQTSVRLASAIDNNDGTATFKVRGTAFVGQYFVGQTEVVAGYTGANAGYNGTWQILSFSPVNTQTFVLGPFTGQPGISTGLATVTTGAETATPTIEISPTGATETGFTTTAPHGLAVGSTITITGVTEPGYDGTWVVASVASPTSLSTQFTVVGLPAGLPPSGDPGGAGKVLPSSSETPRICNTTPAPVTVSSYLPIMYAGLRGGVTPIYKSGDGGATWTSSSSGLRTGVIGGAAGVDIYAIVVDTFDANRLYAATGDGLYTSADAGAHWTIAGFEGQVVRAVTITQSHLAEGGTTPLLNAPRIFVATDQPNGVFQSQFP
nr:hypothetical protein [Kofleriaceae bacterium]